MKKFLVVFALFIAHAPLFAQYNYHLNNDEDVPVTGWQMGVTGGYYTSLMTNRDDIDADQRMDPQMQNLKYALGIERIYWFQPTVGIGSQFFLWNSGDAYVGDDTITKIQLKGTTSSTYLKLPILFHFKSFNRYYPNRRVRFTVSFGPYAALMTNFKVKNVYTKATDKNYLQEVIFDGLRFTGAGQNGQLSGKIYNPFDLGMVFAFGGEVRLSRRTVLVAQLRADVGFSNIENTRLLTFKADNSSTETNFNVWNGYYAKYVQPNAIDVLNGFEPNRPATKNLSFGGFISLRKYMKK